MDLAAKKILLILCCNDKTRFITEEHVARMVKLYNYMTATYLFVDGLVGNHEDVPIQEAIVDILARHQKRFRGRPIKRRELFTEKLKKQFGMEKLVRTMKAMTDLGVIEERQVESGGQKWTGYILSDQEIPA